MIKIQYVLFWMKLLTITDLVVTRLFRPHFSFFPFLCVDLLQIIQGSKISPSQIVTAGTDSTSYKSLLSFSDGFFILGIKPAILNTRIRKPMG